VDEVDEVVIYILTDEINGSLTEIDEREIIDVR
jgi:hypothetical protein